MYDVVVHNHKRWRSYHLQRPKVGGDNTSHVCDISSPT